MGHRNEPALPPDRDTLRARLEEVAPPLADIYAGACALLSSTDISGLPYFLAHAAREIANGLPEWIAGVVSKKETKGLGRVVRRLNALFPEDILADTSPVEEEIGSQVLVPRDLIEEIARILRHRESRTASGDAVRRWFEWLGPGNRHLAPELAPLIKEWMELRRWFESANHAPRSRSASVPDAREAVMQFERFERWLEALLRGFSAARRELDVILDEAGPDRLAEILPLLVPDAQRRHFFERLAQEGDPAWLGPLRDHGFFNGPPPPGWSAARYLLRMAELLATQEAVAAIVVPMISTNRIIHWWVQGDFVDIALRLPESSAATISRKMRQWGRAPTATLPVKLATLAVRLARARQMKDALALMKSLLASRRPAPPKMDAALPVAEPEPRIGRWALAEVIERVLPDFISATGLSGLRLVCGSLEKALGKRSEGAESGGDDGSHIWRRRIEDRNVEHTFAPILLLTAVARSTLQLAAAGTSIVDLVDVLKTHRREAFQRLAQYLLARFPTVAPDANRTELLDRRQFDLFRREYRMLLEAGFRHLAVRDQEAILGWIEVGPDRDRVRKAFESWNGREPTAEEAEQDWRWWQWHWLGPLTADLPVGWQNRQRELNRQFGEPPRANESEFRTSFGHVGVREGPVTPEQVRSLPVPEIARRYRDWHPSPDGRPVLPDDAGPLSNAVAADSQRFATEAACFRGAGPTAVRAVFNGLERASREGRHFEWAQVLELASWALEQRPIELTDDDPFAEQQAWEWARGALMRLLQAAMARPEVAPPAAFRDRIWPLLAEMKDDPPTNRAEAVGAAIEYAKWLKADQGELFDSTPEAASFLEGQLAHPGVARVHEEFGERLAFLAWFAPSWTRANLPTILPPQPDLWNAAWNAYLRRRRLAQRVFEVLRDGYVRAVEQLQPPEEHVLPGVKRDSTVAQEHLAQHVIALYRWGVLEETGSITILDTFFERALARVRRYTLDTIGRSLQQPEEDPGSRPEVSIPELTRLRQLWTGRMQRLPADARVREELPAFGSWFASGQFDDDWAFEQLELVLDQPQRVDGEPILNQDGVLSRLVALADRRPARVARTLNRLAQLTEDASWAYAWPDKIRQIIIAAVRSGDGDAQKSAVAFLDRLGALGVQNVEELVGASHDLEDPLSIPYFLWDQPLTVAQFREGLSSASDPERDRLLGLLLREAADSDVWKFTTPSEVLSRWNGIERYLGRRRGFWNLLLKKWQEQGLPAR